MSFRRVAPIVALAAQLLTAPASATTHSIGIVDYSFGPVAITVSQGDDVEWTNYGAHEHTTTRTGFPAWSVHLTVGTSTTITFPLAGTFTYACAIHASMHGSVKVPVQASPPSGSTTTTFTIRVAGVNAASGTTYVIQRKAPSGAFKPWKTTTAQTVTFKSAVKGTWVFRSQVKKLSTGKASGFSPSASVTIG